MAIILGVTHPVSANTAAALLVDGELVAMAEEERFLRIKHAPFKFPLDAINFCLRSAGIRDSQVDAVAVGYSRVWRIFQSRFWQLLKRGEIKSLPDLWLRWMRGITLERKLAALRRFPSRVYFVRHHTAHIASAFYASGFEEAIVLSLDGSGGEESGLLCRCDGSNMEILDRITDDQSWGMAWEMITSHLGFRAHSDEGKVMGLAAYGRPRLDGLPGVDWNHPIPTISKRALVRHLTTIPPCAKGRTLTDAHKDLAATLQASTERATRQAFEHSHSLTGIESFCFCGGVALNCANNGRLSQLPFVKHFFVQPVSNDAGTALGAALYLNSALTASRSNWRMQHLYWGPSYSEEEIAETVKLSKLTTFRPVSELGEVARILSDGKTVGWFQGRMEVGPRALGSRSILADPRTVGMRDLANSIKGREYWRPLAPSILEEQIRDFVVGAPTQPDFMIVAHVASERARELIPATVHVDGTLRPQAVGRGTSPAYWELISAFFEITGVPALLNTSFNLAGEPIVMSPSDAIGSFFRSGLDYLVLGNLLIWK